ncbi:winged helix-turn-helix transcriptional regulator [Vallitalea pronyensis]|uniref:Winged helix-turn-helix transcriptional regulator n=1 Tax=Vallitalea pronyensis TaxID=1348613 RepID=A0A8J8SIK0_9FIRM|nr:winged helix-turn-helix transcriptional regulator [Vallitalea pronyensis]QUI25015.1 winged helix-turn-helix transcriptional regulator [Vallitalea pronyensis]
MPQSVYSDNEFFIMSEIADNESISQRELSRKLGLSLGSINVLINKMIREGLIKMEQVSQKQVFYMLTPVGIMEKANKTVRYLKVHYRAIYETKEKVKSVLSELSLKYDDIFILKSDDEMGEVIGVAVTEFLSENKSVKVNIIGKNSKFSVKKIRNAVLLYVGEDQELMGDYLKINNVKMINLLERL